eukprot:UN03210
MTELFLLWPTALKRTNVLNKLPNNTNDILSSSILKCYNSLKNDMISKQDVIANDTEQNISFTSRVNNTFFHHQKQYFKTKPYVSPEMSENEIWLDFSKLVKDQMIQYLNYHSLQNTDELLVDDEIWSQQIADEYKTEFWKKARIYGWASVLSEDGVHERRTHQDSIVAGVYT